MHEKTKAIEPAVAAVMSLHRLSAGSGYRYLVRHTACGDVQRDPDMPLTAYYTASGYPPGRWLAAGWPAWPTDGDCLLARR